MISYADITRRSFMRTLLCRGAMFSFPPLLVPIMTKIGKFRELDLLAMRLANFFAHKHSARIVGSEYLRCTPRETDIDLLVNLICAPWAGRYKELTSVDGGKLRELLTLQQRQDFEHGRIVNVQGWILSETEVRLCALAVLS
jgi:hypothetical protein